MKRTKNAITAMMAAGLCALLLNGCSPAMAEQDEAQAFTVIGDKVSHQLIVEREQAKRAHAIEAWNATQGQREAAEAPIEEEAYGYTETAYYEPQNVSYYGNPDGLNNFDGVNDYNGRHETFYSGDNAVYRDQLTVDDQGFYRDGEGRYAVAVSDMPEGTVFQGSQGECVVVDSGCEPGTTDYCVSGW